MDARAALSSPQVPRLSRKRRAQLFFVVDAELADQVAGTRWTKKKGGYLEGLDPVTKRRTTLHRFVWALTHGGVVPKILDHINGVPWDCRLSNLRPATPSLNARNRRVRRKHQLPVGVGVRVGPHSTTPRRFYARIRVGGKQRMLGYFLSADEAAEAYQIACKSVSERESSLAAKECVHV